MIEHLARKALARLLGVVDALQIVFVEDAPFGALPRLTAKTTRENAGARTPCHQTVSHTTECAIPPIETAGQEIRKRNIPRCPPNTSITSRLRKKWQTPFMPLD
jgi:hypothetical protein